MHDADKKAFLSAWRLAHGICNSEPDATDIEFAFRLLKDYELNDVLNGIKAHALDPKTGQFAVKPADVVRHIEGNPDDRARKAWQKVAHAIEVASPHDPVAFDDPVIHRVLERSGWNTLIKCQTYHDLSFRQKEFENTYKACVGDSGDYPAYLCASPQDIPPEPVFIGDVMVAKTIAMLGQEKRLSHDGPMHISKALQ